MLNISSTTKNVLVLSTVIVIIILINIIYILYHLYMKKKMEFSNRLLNVLYAHVAIYYQIGSFVNFLLILNSLELLELRNNEVNVLLMFRYIQLLAVFYYFVAISISHTLHTFKMSLYLHLSCTLYKSIVVFVTILISRYLYKSHITSLCLNKYFLTFSILSNILIYQVCGGVHDGFDCFGLQTKTLYKISLTSTLFMNFLVFQDYIARFMKKLKWKSRNVIIPADIPVHTNRIISTNEAINFDSSNHQDIDNQINNATMNCFPILVDLPTIENHIR